MKPYKKTIVKKHKYKNYITCDVSKILNYCVNWNAKRYADNWQRVEEDSHTLNLEHGIYEQGTSLYGFDSMKKEAIEYLQKKTNLMKLNDYEEEIEHEIIKACATSFADNYMHESFLWVKKTIPEHIDKSLSEYDISKYQILYYSSEDKTLHDEFMYNTDFIRIYLPKTEIKKFGEVEGWNNYTFDEILSDMPYVFKITPINWEYFDPYGTKGDYDNWLGYFNDMEEISYEIKKAQKDKQDKVKKYIKSKLPLIYRNKLKEEI